MYPNLRAEMARKGLSIEKLAELLGITRGTLTAKLAGKRGFSLEEARMIRKILEVQMEYDELFMRAE